MGDLPLSGQVGGQQLQSVDHVHNIKQLFNYLYARDRRGENWRLSSRSYGEAGDLHIVVRTPEQDRSFALQ
jgi:hypothetical protein